MRRPGDRPRAGAFPHAEERARIVATTPGRLWRAVAGIGGAYRFTGALVALASQVAAAPESAGDSPKQA